MVEKGGKKQLRLGSIKNVAANQDYRVFIRALTICQIAIKGMNNTVIKKLNKMDFGIIDRLCKHLHGGGEFGNYTNKFPKYVNELFRSFAMNQVSIGFNFGHMQKYEGIKKIFCVKGIEGLLRFDYLLHTFKNCHHITILENPSKPLIIEFTSKFVNTLKEIMININSIKNTEIQTILYKSCIGGNVKSNKKRYEREFGKIGWQILFENHGNAQEDIVYSLTLSKGYNGPMNERIKSDIHNRRNGRRRKIYQDRNQIPIGNRNRVKNGNRGHVNSVIDIHRNEGDSSTSGVDSVPVKDQNVIAEENDEDDDDDHDMYQIKNEAHNEKYQKQPQSVISRLNDDDDQMYYLQNSSITEKEPRSITAFEMDANQDVITEIHHKFDDAEEVDTNFRNEWYDD